MLTADNTQKIAGSHEQYVDSVMAIAGYSLTYLTTVLKYDSPPPDDVVGGGPEYDIYLEELGSDGFGLTSWDEPFTTTPNQKFATYIVVDNDFYGNRTSGLNGLRVTIAHELHHAIQVGSYGVWTSVPNADFQFYELTSTWIEDVVYPSVGDYLFEIPKYFTRFRDSQGRSYSLSFYPRSFSDPFFPGYERVVWAQYLVARFGPDIIRQIWERMKAKPYLRAASDLLLEKGTSVESEFATFSVWNYYTADRANTALYYPKGNLYPRFTPNATANFAGMSSTISSGAYPLSTQMLEFRMPTDTVVAIVANVNAGSAQTSALNTPQALRVTLSSSRLDKAYQNLQDGKTVSLDVENSHLWRITYLGAATDAITTANVYPSPNPFLLTRASGLTVPMAGIAGKEVTVSIYSASLDLLFSNVYTGSASFGREEVVVPVHDFRSQVSSGVHFLVMKYGEQIHWWKVAFIQ